MGGLGWTWARLFLGWMLEKGNEDVSGEVQDCVWTWGAVAQ